ncbi:hypothetical protein D0962_37255 [Leptolyngbyaceae cyanobacterium CCMR0082]|uniref:Uncharacterized protein n=1 Tax=Adonisia turfae CCMR0082 TaxID=2304604 RepID=A0A6M0SJ90_9CYAN|nr:hypothetical protein [Adonisia turfae CCMR0082]
MQLPRRQIMQKKRLLSAAIISGIAPAIISGIHNKVPARIERKTIGVAGLGVRGIPTERAYEITGGS